MKVAVDRQAASIISQQPESIRQVESPRKEQSEIRQELGLATLKDSFDRQTDLIMKQQHELLHQIMLLKRQQSSFRKQMTAQHKLLESLWQTIEQSTKPAETQTATQLLKASPIMNSLSAQHCADSSLNRPIIEPGAKLSDSARANDQINLPVPEIEQMRLNESKSSQRLTEAENRGIKALELQLAEDSAQDEQSKPVSPNLSVCELVKLQCLAKQSEQLLIEEAERQRLAEETAELRRIVAKAEQKLLEAEAEQRRLEEDYEQKCQAGEATWKRLEEDEEQKRLEKEGELPNKLESSTKKLSTGSGNDTAPSRSIPDKDKGKGFNKPRRSKSAIPPPPVPLTGKFRSSSAPPARQEVGAQSRTTRAPRRANQNDELATTALQAKSGSKIEFPIGPQSFGDKRKKKQTEQFESVESQQIAKQQEWAEQEQAEQQKLFEQQRDEEARLSLEEDARILRDAAEHAKLFLEAEKNANSEKITIKLPFSEEFIQEGRRLFERGKYDEADAHYRAGLPAMEGIFGREHLAVVDILQQLGNIGLKRGKYADTEIAFKEALQRRIEIQGAEHSNVADTLNDLGQFYIKTANYKKARRMLTDSLELRRQNFGDEHRATAQSCHDLALLHMIQGAYHDASVMMERAYTIRKNIFGKDHLESKQSENDMGRLFLLQNELALSEKMLKGALDYRREHLGEEHPDYAEALHYYGDFLITVGRYDEAEQLLQTALKIRKQNLSERHPETAAAYNQLGILYLQTGKLDESKRYLGQSLYIRKTAFGENHPDTAKSMHDFAMLCWRRGRQGDQTGLIALTEGLHLAEKSFSIRKNILGALHPETLESMNTGGGILTLLNSNPGQTEFLLRTALAKRKQLFKHSHLSIADSCHSLAVFLLTQHKTEEAKSLLQEELMIRISVLGDDNPLIDQTNKENIALLQMND